MVAVDPDTDRTVALRKARFKVRLRRAAEACGYENLYQLGRVCGISKDSFGWPSFSVCPVTGSWEAMRGRCCAPC